MRRGMKIFRLLVVCIIVLTVSGCAGRSRGYSGSHYHVHKVQHLSIFKIKSPDRNWYTNNNFNAGKNEPITFDGPSPESLSEFRVGAQLVADFEYGRFLPDIDYFIRKLDMLAEATSAPPYLKSYSKKIGPTRKQINFKGKICFLMSYEHADEHRQEQVIISDKETTIDISTPAKVGKVIECPVFINKTFGVIQIAMRVTADTLEHAKYAFKELEPDFNKSLDSFKFLRDFSQTIPPGLSLELQLRKAESKWYWL